MAGADTMVMSRQQQRSDTDFSIASTIAPPPDEEQTSSSRESNALSYMHRPPTIMPNYGKKSRGSVLPKSNVSRVLLYDNITQQTMLDVRLNSIQTQSYKTHRELDMHMKSFLTRRKARQKALKHLTRVQHHEDYLEFQRDHQQQQQQQQLRQQRHRIGSFESESSEERGSPANQFLPHIGHRSASFHPHPNHPSPGISGLRKQAKSMKCSKESNRSDNTNGNGTSGTGDTDDDKVNGEIVPSFEVQLNEGDAGSAESLPQIPLSAPGSLARNNRAQVGKYQPLTHDKRIGYKMVQGSNGYTRIFHALPEVETGAKKYSEKDNSPRPTANSPKPQKLLPLRRGMPNRRNRLRVIKNRELKNQGFEHPTSESPTQHGEADDSGNYPEEPLTDFRFLHLRKLLIPQYPPNEGYTELSPSFPRRYPDIKDVVKLELRRKKNKTHRKINGLNTGVGFGDEDEEYSGDELFSEISDLEEGQQAY